MGGRETGGASWRRRRSLGPLLKPQNTEQAHCVLPLEYDFFADYKSIRTHVWFEAKERDAEASGADERSRGREGRISDFDWAVGQYLDTYSALGESGIKVLHWPGELRKPWQRWHRAVRSPWD